MVFFLIKYLVSCEKCRLSLVAVSRKANFYGPHRRYTFVILDFHCIMFFARLLRVLYYIISRDDEHFVTLAHSNGHANLFSIN